MEAVRKSSKARSESASAVNSVLGAGQMVSSSRWRVRGGVTCRCGLKYTGGLGRDKRMEARRCLEPRSLSLQEKNSEEHAGE